MTALIFLAWAVGSVVAIAGLEALAKREASNTSNDLTDDRQKMRDLADRMRKDQPPVYCIERDGTLIDIDANKDILEPLLCGSDKMATLKWDGSQWYSYKPPEPSPVQRFGMSESWWISDQPQSPQSVDKCKCGYQHGNPVYHQRYKVECLSGTDWWRCNVCHATWGARRSNSDHSWWPHTPTENLCRNCGEIKVLTPIPEHFHDWRDYEPCACGEPNPLVAPSPKPKFVVHGWNTCTGSCGCDHEHRAPNYDRTRKPEKGYISWKCLDCGHYEQNVDWDARRTGMHQVAP